MAFNTLRSAMALLGLSVAAANAATLYMVGDSTMAPGGGGAGTDGWAQYLTPYFNIPVVNRAVAGRSARSYTTEGRFDTLYTLVKSGDFVVIEFGHNDGTSNPDNGRSDCPGSDYATTCVVVDNGANVTTHTFPYYIQNAITTLAAKGVKTIASSSTPDNIWPLGSSAGNRFAGYAALAASRARADYVDHDEYVIRAYTALGQSKVTTFYPNDHTHTSPAGALVVAQAFVKGLTCGGSALKSHVTANASAIPNSCI